MESMLVLSFQQQTPGPFASRLRRADELSATRRCIKCVRSFGVTAVVITLMQYIGASSLTLQRILIHLMQPLLMACLIICLNLCYHYPVFFVIVVVISLFLLARIVYSKYHSDQVMPVAELRHEITKEELSGAGRAEREWQATGTAVVVEESGQQLLSNYAYANDTTALNTPPQLAAEESACNGSGNVIDVEGSEISDAEISDIFDTVISESSDSSRGCDSIIYSPDLSTDYAFVDTRRVEDTRGLYV